MKISLNQNFVDKVSNLYSDISSSSTALPDSNAFINSEKIFGSGGSEKIIKVFPETEVDIKTIREEIEPKINTESVYKLANIKYGIEETNDSYTLHGQHEKSSFEASSLSDDKKENSDTIIPCPNVPFSDDISYISSSTNVNGNLEVYYTESTERMFEVVYSEHSQKHYGDRTILFQAISIGINNSFVITDEYEKENKKNLGYDLRINGIKHYSLFHILPIMAMKDMITEEEMLRASKELSNYTNRSVDEKILIKSLNKIKKERFWNKFRARSKFS